ncbi:MAG: FAD-dependent oxidoreductase [Candidatus Neptunochlamydia sp.]|nr:FAD-dependent oxidoreductase [Candidatus Neptunochlamydia sp.]
MHLEKYLKKTKEPFEISIVNRENYFVFQPMLAEVVGGSLGILDTINPIRKLLKKTTLFFREIDSIDIENQKIYLTPKFSHKVREIVYDYLVLALGTVTDFRGMTGLHEHALPFKNLADSIAIRNQVIDVMETAARTYDETLKNKLLTFVVGGGGFSGTEVVAELNDLVHKLAKDYPEIDQNQIRVILIHSKDRLMDKEMPESLGLYAEKLLKKRGVEFRFEIHLRTVTPEEAILDTGEHIPTKTVISTVPSSSNPLIETLPLKLERGKIVADARMQAEGYDNIWAIGDCVAIPHLAGKGICPPTAQFAIREAKVLAYNIAASLSGWEKKEFRFKALGMMGALGHQSAVAELFGKFKFSGLFAWVLWRMIYWIKLPGMSRKVKVALTWMLDTMIPIEAVQIKTAASQGIAQLHFETNAIIFHEGDVGDYLYIVVNGEVEIYQEKGISKNVIAKLGKGEYFGEMALLNQCSRTATVKCLSPVDVLALKKRDFGILISNFQQLKKDFEETEKIRMKEMK